MNRPRDCIRPLLTVDLSWPGANRELSPWHRRAVAIVFLIGDDSITGHPLICDGGLRITA